MTAQNPPSYLQASLHPAKNLRKMTQALATPGVVGTDDLKVSQSLTPAMSVLVPNGSVFIAGTAASDQGNYFAFNNGDTTLTITAAHATNPRIDRIVAKVEDAETSGVVNAWSLAVVTGTPAGSPVAPAAPANSVTLATVAVAALATTVVNANITDLRPRAAALGAITVCKSTTRPSSPYVGQEIYETDTARKLVYAGPTSGWNPPWNIGWGRIASTKITAVVGGYTGTVVDVTGLSVSAGYVAGRRYRIQLQSEVSASVVADVGVMQITDGSNVQIGRAVQYFSHGGANTLRILHEESSVATATVTRKARYSRVIGTGTHQIEASATSPAWLIVEDIGPSSNPT